MQEVERIIQDIESKSKQYNEEFQKLNTYVIDNEKSAQKLMDDRNLAKARMQVLSGALQAYEDSLTALRKRDDVQPDMSIEV